MNNPEKDIRKENLRNLRFHLAVNCPKCNKQIQWSVHKQTWRCINPGGCGYEGTVRP